MMNTFQSRRVVVKVGTSTLTYDNGNVNLRNLEKLCKVLDSPSTPAVEKAALRVFDEIYAQLIDNRKQTTEEMTEEIGGDGLSQLSDSGP